MNLRRQLLLVSLLTLVLPWAGCQFIRETESALREGQQAMLAGTALAIADSLSQFPANFFSAGSDRFDDSQVYGHPLGVEPLLDGYTDDWTLEEAAVRRLDGADGDIRLRTGVYRRQLFFAVEVRDASPVYGGERPVSLSDRLEIRCVGEGGERALYVLSTEAPGMLMGRRRLENGLVEESRIEAHWLDTPTGYRVEGRIPLELVGERFGLSVVNVRDDRGAVRSSTYSGERPGRFIMPSPVLTSVILGYARPDLRLIVTDRAGWRLAQAGELATDERRSGGAGAGWARIAYTALLERGDEAAFAEPDPSGRERQPYLQSALDGEPQTAWFRSAETGRAVVAVAQPVWSGNVQTGAVILQQGTAAILSLTNTALSRLVNFTLLATLVVAIGLIGYASWLSLRIRRLSTAAGTAVDVDPQRLSLPSASAGDEIGDLSRSFAAVLRQLGNYNEYLRTLASKLSHELRTPLTIVNSSLENLEHEPLSEEAAKYTARARDGAARLKKILDAMSEANRVEELMKSVEAERFDLAAVLASATEAYGDAWPERRFRFESRAEDAMVSGSPELIVQLLDKLVDNAVSFSSAGDLITIGLESDGSHYRISVTNPGPPLPEDMRHRLFDSMVSLRRGDPGQHLGLGLYIARLIVEGHGGQISAANVEGGAVFRILLPALHVSADKAG